MKIKNKDLVHVVNFLTGLTVKGLKSIHRTSIANKLLEKMSAFEKAQAQLRDEYKDDGKGHQEEFKKLLESYVTIDDTDSKVELNSIKSVIKPLVAEDSEYEFKDSDGIGVAVMYEALNLGETKSAK